MQSGWYNRSEDKSTFLSRLPSGSERTPTWFSRGSGSAPSSKAGSIKFQIAVVSSSCHWPLLCPGELSPGVSYFSAPEFVNEFTTSKKWFTYCFTPHLLPRRTPDNHPILLGGTFYFMQLSSCSLQFPPKATISDINRNEWARPPVLFSTHFFVYW